MILNDSTKIDGDYNFCSRRWRRKSKVELRPITMMMIKEQVSIKDSLTLSLLLCYQCYLSITIYLSVCLSESISPRSVNVKRISVSRTDRSLPACLIAPTKWKPADLKFIEQATCHLKLVQLVQTECDNEWFISRLTDRLTRLPTARSDRVKLVGIRQ